MCSACREFSSIRAESKGILISLLSDRHFPASDEYTNLDPGDQFIYPQLCPFKPPEEGSLDCHFFPTAAPLSISLITSPVLQAACQITEEISRAVLRLLYILA